MFIPFFPCQFFHRKIKIREKRKMDGLWNSIASQLNEEDQEESWASSDLIAAVPRLFDQFVQLTKPSKSDSTIVSHPDPQKMITTTDFIDSGREGQFSLERFERFLPTHVQTLDENHGKSDAHFICCMDFLTGSYAESDYEFDNWDNSYEFPSRIVCEKQHGSDGSVTTVLMFFFLARNGVYARTRRSMNFLSITTVWQRNDDPHSRPPYAILRENREGHVNENLSYKMGKLAGKFCSRHIETDYGPEKARITRWERVENRAYVKRPRKFEQLWKYGDAAAFLRKMDDDEENSPVKIRLERHEYEEDPIWFYMNPSGFSDSERWGESMLSESFLIGKGTEEDADAIFIKSIQAFKTIIRHIGGPAYMHVPVLKADSERLVFSKITYDSKIHINDTTIIYEKKRSVTIENLVNFDPYTYLVQNGIQENFDLVVCKITGPESAPETVDVIVIHDWIKYSYFPNTHLRNSKQSLSVRFFPTTGHISFELSDTKPNGEKSRHGYDLDENFDYLLPDREHMVDGSLPMFNHEAEFNFEEEGVRTKTSQLKQLRGKFSFNDQPKLHDLFMKLVSVIPQLGQRVPSLNIEEEMSIFDLDGPSTESVLVRTFGREDQPTVETMVFMNGNGLKMYFMSHRAELADSETDNQTQTLVRIPCVIITGGGFTVMMLFYGRYFDGYVIEDGELSHEENQSPSETHVLDFFVSQASGFDNFQGFFNAMMYANRGQRGNDFRDFYNSIAFSNHSSAVEPQHVSHELKRNLLIQTLRNFSLPLDIEFLLPSDTRPPVVEQREENNNNSIRWVWDASFSGFGVGEKFWEDAGSQNNNQRNYETGVPQTCTRFRRHEEEHEVIDQNILESETFKEFSDRFFAVCLKLEAPPDTVFIESFYRNISSKSGLRLRLEIEYPGSELFYAKDKNLFHPIDNIHTKYMTGRASTAVDAHGVTRNVVSHLMEQISVLFEEIEGTRTTEDVRYFISRKPNRELVNRLNTEMRVRKVPAQARFQVSDINTLYRRAGELFAFAMLNRFPISIPLSRLLLHFMANPDSYDTATEKFPVVTKNMKDEDILDFIVFYLLDAYKNQENMNWGMMATALLDADTKASEALLAVTGYVRSAYEFNVKMARRYHLFLSGFRDSVGVFVSRLKLAPGEIFEMCCSDPNPKTVAEFAAFIDNVRIVVSVQSVGDPNDLKNAVRSIYKNIAADEWKNGQWTDIVEYLRPDEFTKDELGQVRSVWDGYDFWEKDSSKTNTYFTNAMPDMPQNKKNSAIIACMAHNRPHVSNPGFHEFTRRLFIWWTGANVLNPSTTYSIQINRSGSERPVRAETCFTSISVSIPKTIEWIEAQNKYVSAVAENKSLDERRALLDDRKTIEQMFFDREGYNVFNST